MKRSKFSLSHYKLMSCNMGALVPIGLTEVLPGDTVQQATSALVRVSPLVNPVMHPVHVRIHHWFVPMRILWDDWEDFITGGADGADDSLFPVLNAPASGGFAVGSLADYLGCPPGINSLEVSALPFRAYAKIWNEWYRDQDLQAELPISYAAGTDTTTSTSLKNVAWEKDYFTSARPWTQKGPEVTVPLGTSAPVFARNKTSSVDYPNFNQGSISGGAALRATTAAGASGPFGDYDLRTDLTLASSATINDLREAFALQRYQEVRARYGSRYTEYLAYLGIRSSDARLQRPEYLGGGKQTIQFSEVLQTAPADGSPVGNLAGHGIGAVRSNRYRKFIEEHGYVMSFITVQPKTIYSQGLHRTWNRRIKEDFFQKELQHIGQQEILNKEIYAAHATPDGTFGYQDRYDEYRRTPSGVAGDFRTTLNDWHFARQFATAPVLNGDFVQSNPTNRPFADQTEGAQHLWIMANHSIQARRIVSASTASFIK